MGNWKIDIDPAEKDAIYSLFKAPESSDTPFIDYESDKLTTLRHYAFRNCKTINSVNTPNVSCISQACFRDSSITQYDLINVNRIMNYAFYNCSNFHGDTVHRIRSNATVLDIGSYAFYNCNFKFPYLYAFTACIGNYAFHLSSKQDSLQRVNINQINYCNDNAFSNQGNLKAITGRSGGRMTNFYNIGTNAFNGCTNLEIINATNIDNICANAFNGCTSLTTINAVNVNKVINYAFNGCTGLIQIKDIKLTNVYTNAFNGCTGLTDIINVHFINANANAFRGCTSLTNLTNVYLQEIYAKTFDSLPLQTVVMNYIATTSNANIFNNCTQLSNLQINAGSIGNKPYNNINNSNLTVTLTNSTYGTMQVQAFPNVKYFYANEYTGTFPERMFENNPNLTTVNIRNVEKIDNYTFSNCISLDKCLGNGNIGQYAYYNCSISCASSFYNALKIDDYGIYNGMIDKSFTNINWNQTIEAGNYAFGKINYNIMNFPVLNTIYSNTFKEFAGNGLHFDVLSATPTNMCNNLTQLKELYINKVKTINEYTCNNCYNLTIVNCNSGTSSLQSLLTNIYNYAFSNCQALTTFITNSGIINVGTNAFKGCVALTTFNGVVNFMTGTNYQFYNCKALTSIKLSHTVTAIPNYCFYFSNALKTIGTEYNIANLYYITQVGNYSFYNGGIVDLRFDNTKEVIISSDSFNGCPITSITWPKIAKLGTYVFMKTALTSIDVTNVRNSSNTMYIPNYTFRECKSLTTVTGLNHTINSYAFSQCTALTSVQGQITNISNYAFNGCTALMTFECNVDRIFQLAFVGCNNLQILKNANYIYSDTFKNYTSLTQISNINDMGNACFEGCTSLTNLGNISNANTYAFKGCTSLTNTNAISVAKNYSFQGCSGLKNIYKKLTTIGDYAFNGCVFLKTANISNLLTSIGNYAFAGDSLLENVSIDRSGSTTTNSLTIGNYAFWGCSKMYISNALRIDYIGQTAFGGCKSFCLLSGQETQRLIYLSGTNMTISSYAFDDCNIVNFSIFGYASNLYTFDQFSFSHNNKVSLTNQGSTACRFIFNSNAFFDCDLVKITNLNLKAGTFQQDVFRDCTNVQLIMPNVYAEDSEGFYQSFMSPGQAFTNVSYTNVWLKVRGNNRESYLTSWKSFFNNNDTTTKQHIVNVGTNWSWEN